VYQLKRDFPHLTMSINGGIKSLEEAKAHLEHMDGVMVGREAYQNPGILATVDREIFGVEGADTDPVAVVRAMYPYIERAEQWHLSWYHPPYVVPGIPARVSGALPERECA
jgi:tRNA-dihydrouridine synthase A